MRKRRTDPRTAAIRYRNALTLRRCHFRPCRAEHDHPRARHEG